MQEGRHGNKLKYIKSVRSLQVLLAFPLWSNASGSYSTSHHACTWGCMKAREQRAQRVERTCQLSLSPPPLRIFIFPASTHLLISPWPELWHMDVSVHVYICLQWRLGNLVFISWHFALSPNKIKFLSVRNNGRMDTESTLAVLL